MTEEEWAVSTDPIAMLEAARESLRSDWPHGQRTARKRVLFGLACCRLIWPLIEVDDRCRRAFVLTELEIEGRAPASEDEEDAVWADLKNAYRHPEEGTPVEQMMAASAVADIGSAEFIIGDILRGLEDWGDVAARTRQVAGILHDIVGNPFRPMSADPAWLTPTVTALAQQMYDSRDFSALPILADALQDASCDRADVLAHCRGPGPHVRGCWVLDLVLGKQ